jgi:hypothetical protein
MSVTVPTAAPAFGAQVIGQTENALNAILERQPAGTGITGAQWVTLTLAVLGGGALTAEMLTWRALTALKVDAATAAAHVAELTAAGLLHTTPDGTVEATDRGAAEWTRVRGGIAGITERLWGDLPAEDLATADRVLGVVRARANAVPDED